MLLRPQGDSTFQVIGESFVHGLNDGIGFLGSLPDPWIAQVYNDGTGLFTKLRFFNPKTNVVSDEDPRLDPLPEEWEPHDRERTAEDPRIFRCFKNKLTGELVNSDPRLLPQALEARGVKLRTFSLA
jgi:hypothetical protein